MKHVPRSRHLNNPIDLTRNRGIDHHFCSDEDNDFIVGPLLSDFAERRLSTRKTVERASGDNAIFITRCSEKTTSGANAKSRNKKGEPKPPF
jgi:hypothetical protein